MEVDRSELFLGVIGTLSSYLISETLSRHLQSPFSFLITLAKQYKNGTTFSLSTSILNTDFKVASKDVAADMSLIIKILQVSETIAVSSAFWVSLSEISVNFFRSWKGERDRPFVVDILEGGIRGSLVGLAVSALHRDVDHRGVQITTGIFIGYAIGMMSAFIGSVGGYFAQAIENPSIKPFEKANGSSEK